MDPEFQDAAEEELWIGKKLVELKIQTTLAALHWPMHARLAGTESLSGFSLGHAARRSGSLRCTPLSLACQKGHKEIVEALLGIDASITGEKSTEHDDAKPQRW